MAELTQEATGAQVRFYQWMPTGQQISNAVQMRLPAAIDGEELERAALAGAPATTMRQGLGLVILVGILAGSIPFIGNWFFAARSGTAVPLMLGARAFSRDAMQSPQMLTFLDVIENTAQTIAGLEPPLPGLLAAGLTALGVWVNSPLNMLSIWIVYGIGVLVICHLLGATTTLQRFYAGTSYAFTPLVLTALSPLPCLGPVIGLLATIWAFTIYALAVRAATGLKWTRIIIAMLTPVAFLALLVLLSASAIAASLLRLLF